MGLNRNCEWEGIQGFRNSTDKFQENETCKTGSGTMVRMIQKLKALDYYCFYSIRRTVTIL